MSDDNSERAARWWRAVEDEVARRGSGDELPDPWADAVPEAPELTDDQRELLGGVEDQPAVTRLTRLDPADAADLAGPSEVGDDTGLARLVDDMVDEEAPRGPDPAQPGS